jgi:hypothetical protein
VTWAGAWRTWSGTWLRTRCGSLDPGVFLGDDTITVQTRNQVRHHLVLDGACDAGAQEQSTPAADPVEVSSRHPRGSFTEPACRQGLGARGHAEGCFQTLRVQELSRNQMQGGDVAVIACDPTGTDNGGEV